MSSTARRHAAILELIPEEPRKISTTQILKKLIEDHQGYDNAKKRALQRRLQRDLILLSSRGNDLICDNEDRRGRRKYWYFRKGRKSQSVEVPILTDSMALTLRLAEDYLQAVLPPFNLDLLERYFNRAREKLSKTKLANWPSKVKIIHRGPELIPPKVKPEVQEVVSEAILKGRQIDATYRGREEKTKDIVLNPLGLVVRDGVIYLVATAWDYPDVRHYVLHRMTKAELSTEHARTPAGFDLESYIRDQKEFAYPVSRKKIKLRALFDADAAFHLRESRLSPDQTMTEKGDGRWELHATVDDTDELRWWLQGFGNLVEVAGPPSLRREFRGLANAIKARYR